MELTQSMFFSSILLSLSSVAGVQSYLLVRYLEESRQ
jgi:hypothetical protein